MAGPVETNLTAFDADKNQSVADYLEIIDQGLMTIERGLVAGSQTPPAIPLTTVALTNPFAFACLVSISGGTVAVIAINSVVSGVIAGLVLVPKNGTITLTYVVAPTWTWFGLN